jgi:hypothetical protein
MVKGTKEENLKVRAGADRGLSSDTGKGLPIIK